MTIIIPIAIGCAVAVGVALSKKKVEAKVSPIVGAMMPLLREGGPLTVPQIMERLGYQGFMQRGRLMQALFLQIKAGTIVEIPAPAGTPQLEKINVIQYRAT